MIKVVKELLGIDDKNGGRIILLLLFGFLIGIFNVTFFVQSSSSFLNSFDEKADLPTAIIASGVLGVFFAWLFSYLHNRISFFKISIAVITLILLVVIGIRLGQTSSLYIRQLIFISFILVGPFNAITLLMFWGAVGRIFSIKQAKRVIGSIDSGQLLGTIIASFSIPLVLNYMIDSINLLFISGLSIFFALFIFLTIYKRYASSIEEESGREKQKEYKTAHLIKDNYIIAMGLFIIISMIASIFVDYSFLQVTAKNFPDAKDLASFLAKFEGTILIFSFLVQTFVTDRIISIYGLKVALFITPVVLLIFTAAACVVGMILEYGNIPYTFLLFFMAIALSKLFVTALKDAIDNPTFKLYFLPFDSSVRLDVQTKIEGVVKAFAGLIAGFILISIESVKVFTVSHISFFLILILGGWIHIASRMHKKYKETLQNTLANSKKASEVVKKNEISIFGLLKKELQQENADRLIRALSLIEVLSPSIFAHTLSLVKNLKDERVKEYVSRKLDLLYTNKDEEGKVIDNTSVSSPQNIFNQNPNHFKRLVKSKNSEDRIMAAQLLRKESFQSNLIYINDLLKDYDPEVVFAAIYTAKFLQCQEAWPSLIELIASPRYSNLAADALVVGGDSVVPILEVAFQKTKQKEAISARIINIYQTIGTPLAIEKLWLKLTYPDPRIVEEVLKALNYLQAKAEGDQIQIVRDVLENEIRKAAWNLSAIPEIGEDEANKYLKQALNEELQTNFNHIFILLSLMYDEQAIGLVRENIEAGTSEGRVFALELLDLFLEKEIKTLLFPLMDDEPIAEKIRNLQVYFPRETFNSIEALKQIINRDYNHISRWTKACALYALGQSKHAGISDDLIANFFNPNNLLKETAIWAVANKNIEVFESILDRILSHKKNKPNYILTQFASAKEKDRILRINKIFFLKELEIFKGVPSQLLLEMAEEIRELKLKKGAEIEFYNRVDGASFFMVFSGSLKVYDQELPLISFRKYNLFEQLNLLNLNTSNLKIIAEEHSTLLYIDEIKLVAFMSRSIQLTKAIIQGREKLEMELTRLSLQQSA